MTVLLVSDESIATEGFSASYITMNETTGRPTTTLNLSPSKLAMRSSKSANSSSQPCIRESSQKEEFIHMMLILIFHDLLFWH